MISMLGPPLMTSGLFGTKEYARIYSISNAFFLAGCMIGPMLFQRTADSYRLLHCSVECLHSYFYLLLRICVHCAWTEQVI